MGKNRKKRMKKKQAGPGSSTSGQSPTPKTHIADLDGISELFRSGQYTDGINALKANPQLQQRPFLEQWGRLFMKDGDFHTAAIIFKLVCQHFPQDDKACNALAVAYSVAGENDQALAAMKRCTELAPDSWHHRFNLGKLYMLREEWEKAKMELDAALQGASDQQLPQIQEYLEFCQQKIDFPVVDLSGAGYSGNPNRCQPGVAHPSGKSQG